MLKRLAHRLVNHPLSPWLIVILGVALRLRRYLQDRGVMHDEAQLAMNVMSKSLGQLLFHPLDLGDQAAPVGFLFLQKIAIGLFGKSEWAVRLVPFLAAVIALPLFYAMTKRALPKAAMLLGLAWMALDEHLIRYVAEGKQYSTDVLWTILVVWIAMWPDRRRSMKWLAGVGAIAIWFSHPALFVLGAIGAATVLEDLYSKRKHEAAVHAGIGAVWLGSFLLNFVLISRHYAASEYLTSYWAQRNAFAPIPTGMDQLLWYPRALMSAFENPISLVPPGRARWHFMEWIVLAAFGIGCLMTIKVRPRTGAIVVGTIALCMAASALHKYPFSERLILFCAPLLVLPPALAIGGDWPKAPAVAGMRIAAAGLLLVYPLYVAAKFAVHPSISYDIKPAMRYVKEHWQNGDAMYLHWGSDVLGSYYLQSRPDFAITGAAPIQGVFEADPANRRASYSADLTKMDGRGGAGVLVSMDSVRGGQRGRAPSPRRGGQSRRAPACRRSRACSPLRSCRPS